MKKLLVVEDDLSVRDPLKIQLEKSGYAITVCGTLAEARRVKVDSIDLMILDWELPDGEGLDLLRELRAQGISTPVIFLTARTDVTDRVLGLELGADDYMTKPFDVKELVARIRLRLRQSAPTTANRMEFGELCMDLVSRKVTHRGQDIELTKMEFALLKFFMENPGRALARDEILNKVWGFDNFPSTRTVDSHVLLLREKLAQDFFETLRGFGYRFRGKA